VDDHVDAGELILQLEDSEQRSRLNQAESALEEAEAGLDDARQNFERVQSLYERDVATQSDLDQSRNRFNGAKARVARHKRKWPRPASSLNTPASGRPTAALLRSGW